MNETEIRVAFGQEIEKALGVDPWEAVDDAVPCDDLQGALVTLLDLAHAHGYIDGIDGATAALTMGFEELVRDMIAKGTGRDEFVRRNLAGDTL